MIRRSAFLREAAKENTVTVVHLIYKSKNYESSSKDYDFSHVGMVEHWNAGVRDVHLSMRHKEWLERPQSGETMVTYDMTGDDCSRQAKRSEANMGTLTGKNAVVTGSTSGIGLAYARAFAGAGANVVINGFGAPADIEKERSAIETDYKVKALLFLGRHDQACRDRRDDRDSAKRPSARSTSWSTMPASSSSRRSRNSRSRNGTRSSRSICRRRSMAFAPPFPA